MGRRLPELSLCVQYACNEAGVPSRSQVRSWIRAACQQPAEVAVRFVDADEGQALNRDYRHKDYPTNVLSFPYESSPVVGDLVICAQVVAKEAGERHVAVEAHYAHLIVHGMLHLQGYDHLTAAEAKSMEGRETAILLGLGFADPY